MPRPSLTTLYLALLLAISPAQADVGGRVVSVHDGDTLTVLVERREVKVRLTDIDAPELKQAFGTRSRQSLAELCFGKEASLDVRGRDRYKRTLAIVTCAGTDANVEQAGFAVLKAPDIPSILIETAFISNPDEERKLRSAAYQNQMADALLVGIKRYFAKNPPLARDRLVSIQ